MNQLYECMFVLNNDTVRAGWADIKASVTSTVEKHGGKVVSARHWDERRLAYPIRRRNRATYLLAFCDMPRTAVDPLSRELNISESVLRYLFLATEEVPAKELELSAAEQEKEFTLPTPPDDDAVEEAPEEAKPEEAKPAETKPEVAKSGETQEEKPAAATGGDTPVAESGVSEGDATEKADASTQEGTTEEPEAATPKSDDAAPKEEETKES